MRKYLLNIAVLSVVMFCTEPVFADYAIDPPGQTNEENSLNAAHLLLLYKGQYAQLDKEMNEIQHDYESGRRNDISLLHLFRAFKEADPLLAKKFDEWEAAYPSSYAARHARGVYYMWMGATARGTKFTNQTTDKQFSELQANFEKALPNFKDEVFLTEKPILSYYEILVCAKYSGDRTTAKLMLDAANKIDPKNFIVRFKYVNMLEGRWSGKPGELLGYFQEVSASGMPPDQFVYFTETLNEEIKWSEGQHIDWRAGHRLK